MTIYALAAPPGRGAIAIIRLSGGHTQKVVEKLTGKASPEPRLAALRVLSDPETGDPIDSGLVLFFQAPHSYTSEDMAELHIHGGVAIVDRILEVLSGLEDLRPAEPGEFTRLAVLNGRMDLTQAEAVADMIDAETMAQQKQAFRQMQGALGELYEGWRKKLASSLAHLEADIEFADEDLPGGIGQAVLGEVTLLNDEISAHIRDDRGRTLRHGVEIAIIGAPNVGKSSLLNRLLGYQRAIVSSKEGTTRDTIEEVVNLRGIPLRLIDTAGVRESSDEIEQEGIAMTHGQVARADLVLVIWDLSESFVDSAEVSIPDGARRLDILNKSDLEDVSWAGVKGLRISCESGSGFEDLESAISKLLSLDEAQWGDHSVAVNARHQACLTRAQSSLTRAITSLRAGDEPELTALDLREALTAIGEIAGIVDTEEILGEIFGNFCIGK